MLAWIACSTAAFFAPCVHPCSVSPTTRSANLVAVSDGKLDQALGSLNPADQYNVLLRSLLSSPEDASSRASAMQLIDEMSERSLSLRPDSVVELVDGAMSDKSPVASTVGLLAALLATRRNGATPAFGSSAAWFPSAAIPPSSALPPLPEDEQGAEVTGAAGLAGLLGTAAVVAHPPAGLVLPALGTVWAADRYNQQGKFFDLLGKGVSRLFSQDLRRECTIESGAFLLGYLLGLPCCALAPSSDAALQMLADGNRAGCWLSYEAPERIVDRVLIWLLAPAGIASAVRRAGGGGGGASPEDADVLTALAAESASAARAFLDAARRREAALGVDPQQGGWAISDEDDERRLRWAYGEACALATRFGGVRVELEEAMVEGGVSAGACVLLIEKRLSGVVEFEQAALRARQESERARLAWAQAQEPAQLQAQERTPQQPAAELERGEEEEEPLKGSSEETASKQAGVDADEIEAKLREIEELEAKLAAIQGSKKGRKRKADGAPLVVDSVEIIAEGEDR